MKKYFLPAILVAVLIMPGASAQCQYSRTPFSKRFSYGIELGAGSSSQQFTAGEVTGKPGNGYMAGLAGYLDLSKYFSLVFQPQYEWRKQRNPAGMYRTDNVTLPLSLALTNGWERRTHRYFISMGVYYSNMLWGRSGNAGLDLNNVYNRDELGWQVQVALFVGHIGLSVTSRHSLMDMLRETPPSGVNMRIRSTYASISYMF